MSHGGPSDYHPIKSPCPGQLHTCITGTLQLKLQYSEHRASGFEWPCTVRMDDSHETTAAMIKDDGS